MSENITVPYVLHWRENGSQLTEVEKTKRGINKIAHVAYFPHVIEDNQQIYIPTTSTPVEIRGSNTLQTNTEPQINYIFEVVSKKPLVQRVKKFRRGRPSKSKIEAKASVKQKEEPPKEKSKVLKPAPRTRSGRVVKIPKHIVKDFKILETDDIKKSEAEQPEVKTSEFPNFLEPPIQKKRKNVKGLEFHQCRRKIASQYRCPKCRKAYLGKVKMMQHIQKHPDHGPMPRSDKTDSNFDVWNYLVDITQKCPQAQRGIKFCEELTNLLHNLLLLTSALFKKVDLNKNFVDVDKVLGNAIGLSPGLYSFNDNELYKDVTVLKLLTTTDFFKPTDSVEEQQAASDTTRLTKKSPENVQEMGKEETVNQELNCDKSQKDCENIYFNTELEGNPKKASTHCIANIKPIISSEISLVPDDGTAKKDETSIHSGMLTDNSIMHLSNIRNSVDELMMTSVDSGVALLENSTSSDDVMNMDQFVNERFKKITEPDLELGSAALNLDLPSLDLFEFHTS